MTRDEVHRYLLVRCETTNREGQPSVRFVEHNLFRLWQYAMANKHGLMVSNAKICLWLPEQQWQSQQGYFEALGSHYAVALLRFDLFDSQHQLWERVQRFVPGEDSTAVAQRLERRIPANLAESGDVRSRIFSGYAVAQGDYANLATLGQALDGRGDLERELPRATH